MNSNQNQLCQPLESARFTSPTLAAGHPHAPVHEIHAVDPLHTLWDPSKARTQPYTYSSPSFPIHVPPSSSDLSILTPVPSHTTTTPSPVSSVPTPSTQHSSLRPPSTRPFPAQPSSIALPPFNDRGSQLPVFVKPSPPSQPSTIGATNPSKCKAPLHPLVLQPPFCCLSLRQNRVPLPPHPELPDPERLLDDELEGSIDPAAAKELGDLLWMQQKRVWGNCGGYSDPFLGFRTPTSLLDSKSSSPCEGATPTQPGPEAIALYGPASRNNESVHLGEKLTNPNATALNDEDGGFEEVLDLYRGAVQGSTLSMELELAVGGDTGLTGVSWEAASSLEVSIKRTGSSASSSIDRPTESRICTLVEYKQMVEAEKGQPSLGSAVSKEEPPLRIEWSYSSCGYAIGRVIDSQKARK